MEPPPPRLAILMIVPQYYPLVGGYEQAAQRLSEGLASCQHRVTVVTDRQKRAWPAREVLNGVETRRLWCVFRPGFHTLTAMASLATFLLLRGGRFDVWHIHQYGAHAALAALMGRLMRRPTILKLTASGDQSIEGTVGSSRLPHLFRWVLLKISAVIAMTSETTDHARRFGYPPEAICKIPNGVPMQRFSPAGTARKNELRRTLGLEWRFIALYVGRLSAEKNPDGLLRAWSQALPKLPAMSGLLIVGGGPMEKDLQHLIEELGLGDSVQTLGPRADVERWLGAADVFVLPSHWEGMSNTLLEAMASGVACVTTNVSGAHELVERDNAGVVVPVADPSALGDALVSLANAPDLRQSLGKRARAVVERRYSIEAVTAQYVGLYRTLMAAER